MEENKQNGGKYLIIAIILVIIVIIVAIMSIIATSNDENPIEQQTIKEKEKKEKEEQEEKEAIRKKDTFLKTISNLKYIDEKEFYKNDVLDITVAEETFDIYNANTTKKIYSNNEYGYIWYGTFGLFFEKDNETNIVDDQGNILFTTNKELYYHPGTKLWEYNLDVYDKDGLVEKQALVIDYEGKYILTEKNNKMILEDNKTKEIYSLKLKENASVSSGSLNSIYDEQYALLKTNDIDVIVNVKNGKEVYKAESINYLEDNLFEIDGDTYFVKNDKLAIKVNGTNHQKEVSTRYIAIDNDVYDVNTLEKVDTHTFIPNFDTTLVEKLTSLELTQCRTGYGLKYKGKEILECKYDDISFYNYDITKALMSSNKLYVAISEDGYSHELYDVYNEKIALYNVNDYDYESPFITIYQDDNIYIYNIIDASKTPNENGDDVELFTNYYKLTNGKTDTYYNNKYKKIIEVKNNKED